MSDISTPVQTLHFLSTPYAEFLQPQFSRLWAKNQAKLLDMLVKENIKYPQVNAYFLHVRTESDNYIALILIAALDDPSDPKLAEFQQTIKRILSRWDPTQLKSLANYYTKPPAPSISELATLLQMHSFSKATEVINTFETVTQATDPRTGISKRQYGISRSDLINLNRVLKGFKLKGKGCISDTEQKQLINLLYYANQFSQFAKLNELRCDEECDELTPLLYAELSNAKKQGSNKEQAAARIIACMRETVLRKTDKWANHTQMLDLLYGALHNNESLLHQVRTGEGKSLLSVMRTSYRALNGQIVDIFSSNENLSFRDHQEFSVVFDAFGIRNSYINAKSDFHLYKNDLDSQGIGAVNYCTPGNWGLFLSGVVWQGSGNVNLELPYRVAFVDEGDHILRDEHTQYNFSDSGDDARIYNFDAWVYQEAFEFYSENCHKFEGYPDAPVISRNKEIAQFLERLQEKERHMAPRESRFFRDHVIPALMSPCEETFANCDQAVHKIMTAAHIAAGLKENTHYCVMSETRSLSQGIDIDTGFAKVVINNQVYHFSTYSGQVQQLLHVRLNREAVLKGQAPNFFIEPNSEIALSLNAPYILKNYYSCIEACTGTSGDKYDLALYESDFNIICVIKLPTHAEIQTQYLEPQYIATFDVSYPPQFSSESVEWRNGFIKDGKIEQVAKICEAIFAHLGQPILVTCEDDNEVRNLGEAIKQSLQDAGYPIDTDLRDTKGEKRAKFILDVNSSRKTEAEVLPFSGRAGSITISSRMGRGTDIKPANKEIGLYVIRTYPAQTRVIKQEQGRQGRNGAAGKCQDILNYNVIHLDYMDYYQSSHRDSLNKLLEDETTHLQQKLHKHSVLKKKNKQIWQHLQDHEVDRQQYLIVRTVQRLKQQIKSHTNRFIRKKEDLLTALSGHVIGVLPEIKIDCERERFKAEWKKTHRLIEASWNGRLADQKSGDTDHVYRAFFANTYKIWQAFCYNHPSLNSFLLASMTPERDLDGISDDSPHAKNEQIIQNISDRWFSREGEKQLLAKDTEALERDKKITRKMRLSYHPDKRKSPAFQQLGIQAEVAEQFNIKLNDLFAALEDKIRIAAAIPVTTEPPALVSDQPSANAPRQDDMNPVISFYQNWISGMREHIWDQTSIPEDVASLLLGPQGSGVDQLFQATQAASCHADDLIRHVSLATENASFDEKDNADTRDGSSIPQEPLKFESISHVEQTQRRFVLFQELSKLFNENASCYAISAAQWSEKIEWLSQTTNDLVLQYYPSWLRSFFGALPDKRPNSLRSVEDVDKLNMVFELMFKIYDTAFIPENKASERFMRDAVSLLLTRYQDKFDLSMVNVIESIFVNNEEVSRLMQCESNRADLIALLDFVVESKTDEIRNACLQNFINYVSENEKDLSQHPKSIRPIFDLFAVTQPSFVPTERDLPVIVKGVQPSKGSRAVARAGGVTVRMSNFKIRDSSARRMLKADQARKKAQNGVFLYFLSKRPGYTEKDYQDFVSILAFHDHPHILTGLSEMPPYTSVTYFAQQLRDVPGKHDVGQFQAKLDSISEASRSYNSFLEARGVIATAEHFCEPLDFPTFQVWNACFEKMSMAMSRTFFAAAKECPNISPEVIFALSDVYYQGGVSAIMLFKIIELLKKIQQFPEVYRRQFELILLNYGLTYRPEQAVISDKNIEYIDRFTQLIEHHSTISNDWCQKWYAAWKAKDFSMLMYHDLAIFLKLVVSIPKIHQPILNEQFQIAFQNLPDSLNAMIAFAQRLQNHSLNIFTQEELSSINQAHMNARDFSCLDEHTAFAQELLVLEQRATRSCFREYYRSLHAGDLAKIRRLREALSIFNQISPIPENETCAKFLSQYVNNTSSSAELRDAVEVYLMSLKPQFAMIRDKCFNQMFYQSASIARYRELFTELNQCADMTYQFVEFFEKQYLDAPVVIKTAQALHQALAVHQRMMVPKFAHSRLSTEYVASPLSQEKVNNCRRFIDCIEQHDLPPAAVTMLYRNFVNESADKLDEASHVVKLATRLSGDEALFKHYFSRHTEGQAQRILIMRYVHHGLLDFLGRNFLNKCIRQYKVLQISSSQSMLSQTVHGRSNFEHKLQVYSNMIRDMMHELLEILSKPFATSHFNINYRDLNVPVAEHQASFAKSRQHYASFWLTANRARKNQASELFDNLERITFNQEAQQYYMQTFDQIYATQQAIVHEDTRDNKKRWFTNLNSKGYSRLYDITNEILSDMLKHYHQAAANGSITPAQYQEFREKQIEQLSRHVSALSENLPPQHPLRRNLESSFIDICRSSSLNRQQQTWATLPNGTEVLQAIFDKNNDTIPKNLLHLKESVCHHLKLTEPSFLRVNVPTMGF